MQAPGIQRTPGVVTITYNGEEVTCRPGESLAAALVAAGHVACRVDESGNSRGVFCGMGVCRDCTVTIDGIHGRRSCMVMVVEGMRVISDPSRPVLQAVSHSQPVRHAELSPDVLVIGGGPGGLSAATAAAEAGADVLVVDERSRLGGQYFKQPSEGFSVDDGQLDRQYREGRRLIRRAETAGVRALSGVQVWGQAGPRELYAVGPGTEFVLHPQKLVIASGGFERPVPMPGWTLPGFMATGAAQTLMRSYQVMPGRRVLVTGNGPLNIQVAAELVRAGAEVVAVCELAPIFHPARAPHLARMLASSPDLVVDGLRYLTTLRQGHVPLLVGHSIVRAEGSERVETATVARIDPTGNAVLGTERTFQVDAICAGFGFLPSNELARALGVEHLYSAGFGQLTTVRATTGRTDVEGVWVVGDAGGTGGARLAMAEGTLAGIDVARSLKLSVSPRLEHEEQATTSSRRRSERFERALFRLYAAPLLATQLAQPDTVVCRCEGVPLRAIMEAIAEGTLTMGAIKRVTRAGMGRCQGRYCSSILAAMSMLDSRLPSDPLQWFAPAPPFKPVTVGDAASGER